MFLKDIYYKNNIFTLRINEKCFFYKVNGKQYQKNT